jgi:subfamily B ATP-binding cassette protein MsbA
MTLEKELKRSLRASFRQIAPYLKAYRWRIAIVVIGSVLFGLLRLVDPNIFKAILDEVIVPLANGSASFEDSRGNIIRLTALLLGVNLLGALIFALYSYVSMMVANEMEAKMFQDALTHLQSLDMAFHNSQDSGKILSRVERGIDAITSVLHGDVAKTFLPSLISISCLLPLMFYQNWKLALASVVLLIPHIYISARKARPIYRAQARVNELYEEINHRIYEGVSNIEAVIGCNAAAYELGLFKKDRSLAMDRQRKIAVHWRIQGFSSSLFSALGMISVIWTSWFLVYRGQATIGDVVKFLAYVSMLYRPLLDMVNIHLQMQIGLSKIDRLMNLLKEKPRVHESPDAVTMAPVRHGIEFRGVSFSYDDDHGALHDLNLVIPAGKVTAIVGPSGSGKSTIANLISRYYDPTRGIIMCDAADMRSFKLESVRDQIATVPQRALLFSRSIRENIAYGARSATDAEVIAAAGIANAHGFIMEKGGYESQIGEDGVRLSGGEQQRLSIARASIRNASIVIFDEATSHLDSESEREVQDALWKMLRGKTAVIIAHRLSTVLRADQIVVLVKGRVEAVGTHLELLDASPMYRHLHDLQFRE